LLRYGEHCGFPPSWAEPTLTYAAESGNTIALIPFIHEFDINHKIGGNRTALMVSAANGRFHAVLELIAGGADPSLRDNSNQTAEELASSEGHSAVASLLQHHRSGDWERIQTLASMINDLRRDSMSNELCEYEPLLETFKFETLNSRRDKCNLQGKELIWFRATDGCSIGLNDSGTLVWMFNGIRAGCDG
jgi:hypothetical protein